MGSAESIHVFCVTVLEVVDPIYEIVLDAIMSKGLIGLEHIGWGTTAELYVGTHAKLGLVSHGVSSKAI